MDIDNVGMLAAIRDRQKIELPVTPNVRARTLLAHLWRKYDAAGISMGRSHEAMVLEAALALLGDPDMDDLARLDEDSGTFMDDTRSYLSLVRLQTMRF
jgi:hypothetical protein